MLDNYVNNNTKIQFKCKKCSNIWMTAPVSIKSGSGCPKCNDTRLTNEIVDKFFLENHIKTERIDNYINSQTKIRWKCLECSNIWQAKPCDILRKNKNRVGNKCPNCARYRNERIVGEILDEFQIKHEKITINVFKNKIRPDYYVPALNLIIEYNGIQHYQPTQFGNEPYSNTLKNFSRQTIRDEILREYCRSSGFNLLEIDGREYKSESLRSFMRNYIRRNGYGK